MRHALLLLPAGRLARADGEADGFIQTGSERSVSVNVWAPDGTTGMQAGTSRQVLAYAQMNTWEVWTGSPSGTIQIRIRSRLP